MLPKTRFRQILLSSVAFGIAYIPASIVGDGRLPDELVAFNEARIERDISTVDIVAVLIGFPLAIAAIINIVALYRFRPTARRWAVGITVASLPADILLGPWIDSGLSELVSNASMILWGVVLAMMYCRPYAELFEANTQEPERDT